MNASRLRWPGAEAGHHEPPRTWAPEAQAWLIATVLVAATGVRTDDHMADDGASTIIDIHPL